MEHLFFVQIQVEICAQTHTRVKLSGGMQMKTVLKLLGGYSQIIGGNISPHPPLVSAPLVARQQAKFMSLKKSKQKPNSS